MRIQQESRRWLPYTMLDYEHVYCISSLVAEALLPIILLILDVSSFYESGNTEQVHEWLIFHQSPSEVDVTPCACVFTNNEVMCSKVMCGYL